MNEIAEGRVKYKKPKKNRGYVEQKEIILGVTASIAAYKACEIIRSLREEGFEVTVIMTGGGQGVYHPFDSGQPFAQQSIFPDVL